MPQLKNVDDKARYENAFFAIGRCAETFYLFAPNIPKNLCQIVQNIHGRFRNIEHAYISCASRKGMFNRYHGKRVSERWCNSLPEYYREHLKMDTNARFHLVGKQALPDKKILRNICLYDGQGENECMTSMKTTL